MAAAASGSSFGSMRSTASRFGFTFCFFLGLPPTEPPPLDPLWPRGLKNTVDIPFYVGNCCPLIEFQPGVPLLGGRLPDVELLLAPALRDVAAAAVAVALAAADAAVLVSKQSQQILGLLRLFVPISYGAGADSDASLLSPKSCHQKAKMTPCFIKKESLIGNLTWLPFSP